MSYPGNESALLIDRALQREEALLAATELPNITSLAMREGATVPIGALTMPSALAQDSSEPQGLDDFYQQAAQRGLPDTDRKQEAMSGLDNQDRQDLLRGMRVLGGVAATPRIAW